MKIYRTDYEGLPEWVDRDHVSNNGCGKEYASYLIIEHGDYKSYHSDAMEPEDVRFYRDLSWVAKEIENAFNMGKLSTTWKDI